MKASRPPVDISVVVTCHAEGIILHKTLLAIKRSISFAVEKDKTFITEVIIHADNPTTELREYLQDYLRPSEKTFLYENSFGGPGKSRDFCIKKATGKYIAFIDGDDIMSENWLWQGYRELERRSYGSAVAHSEVTIEFGSDRVALVKKYPAINKDTDALLNVLSGRWNSVIIAPTDVLKRMGYPYNKPGYGFEDWLLSCQLIHIGIDNILVPETVIFVRRKDVNSVWDEHRRDMTVLPANNLLSFGNIRKIATMTTNPEITVAKTDYRQIIKRQAKRVAHKTRTLSLLRHTYHAYLATKARSTATDMLPSWLRNEWLGVHIIERQLFPPENGAYVPVFQSLTDDHYCVGKAYHNLVSQTHHDSYDYVLFVPWLSKGGADLFAINYANTIASTVTNKRVVVIATDPGRASSWQQKLKSSVDFVDFSPIVSMFSQDHQNKILEQFIENSGATHIHILNSVSGYDYVRYHKKYIKGSKKHIVATSFSQSIDNETGRVYGFSHTHVPYIYDQLSQVTTDNEAVSRMWTQEYGFDASKIIVHHQPVPSKIKVITRDTKKLGGPPKVLWAARLAPEKLPTLVIEIAKHLPSDIIIDMYGEADPDYDISFLASLPKNVRYRGSYDGFSSIPTHQYDIYLYTSQFDGMPNVLFEATAAKLPIIASDVGGIPEFIENGCGILVSDIHDPRSYASAILNIDSAKRVSCVKNASRKLKEQYDITQYKRSIEEMLSNISYTTTKKKGSYD